MADNSSKLFQKAITKGFKTTLFTTSTLALMLSSSGALGGAVANGVITNANAAFNDLAAVDTWHDITAAGADGATPVNGPADGFAITYGGAHGIAANVADRAIQAINVAGTNPGLFAVTENTSIGSIITRGNTVAVTIADDKTLTLTGTDATAANHGFDAKTNIYTGLGVVTLNGANAGLTINSANPGKITLASDVLGAGGGILTITTPTDFGGNVGTVGGKLLNAVNFNADSNVTGTVIVDNLNIGGASQVAVTGAIDATTLVFQGDGQLTVGAGIATANVANVNPNTGTLIVNGGNVQAIGAANTGGGNPGPLKQVTFNNAAASTAGNIFAKNVTVNNGATEVKTGTVNGAIDFAAAGKLIANGLVTGSAVLTTDGTLTLNAGIVGGDITSVGGNGTVIVNGGNITNVGTAASAIKQLTFDNGNVGGGITADNIFATDVTIGEDVANGNIASLVKAGAITATTVNFANAGTLTATGAITGDVTFNADGTLTAGAGVEGTVTSVGGNIGTLIVTAGDVTGAIGTNAGDILKQVTFNGVSEVKTIDATNVTLGNAAANVTATGLITSPVSFAADGTLTAKVGIDGAVTSVGNKGTLIVTAGDVTGAIGVNGGPNKLKQVTFNGISGVTTIDATNVTLGNVAANVTATGLITAAVNFAADGELVAEGGITGNVVNSSGTDGKGTLTTLGDVTGNIGADGASLKVFNAKVNPAPDPAIVFGGDVYAKTVNFDNIAGGGAVGTIQVAGDLVTTNINFSANANGGILVFNGGKAQIFKGVIANGGGNDVVISTANKDTAVTAYDASIGTVKTINIGNETTFGVDVSAANVTLLNNQTINFQGAEAVLAFNNFEGAAGNSILLAGNLAPANNGEGNLIFNGGNNSLNVGSSDGVTIRNIGNVAGPFKFSKLTIIKNVTIAEDINLAGINTLVINSGGLLTDKSNTSAKIGQINIGQAAGAGVYLLDPQGGGNNVDILANGNKISFIHEDSTLVLQNSVAGNGTITINDVLDPGDVEFGRLVLDSSKNGGKLILASANGGTYGTAAHPLKELVIQGVGQFQVDSEIFVNTIDFSVANINYNKNINANVTFSAATQLAQGGNINGGVDFQNQAAVITLGDGKNITGAVTSTGGTNGTIIASGASTINGPITGLAMLKVGAKDVTLTAEGDYSITEIQGNGTGTLNLPKIQLTGGINLTGGTALNLNFSNGGRVSGNVGSAANPVGNITTAGSTRFDGSVFATGAANFSGTTGFLSTFNNKGEVTLAKNSVTGFGDNVTATKFIANDATLGFGKNLAFNSDITGSGTTINLLSSQVAYTGTGSFTDKLTLNTDYNGANNSGGNILIKSNSTLDLSQLSNLALNITVTNLNINDIDESQIENVYKIISAETAGGLKPVSADKVSINVNGEQNNFIKVTLDSSALTLSFKDIAEEVIEDAFEPGGELANIPNAAAIEKAFELMDEAPNGSNARQALNNFGRLTLSQSADAVNRLIQNEVKPSETIAAISSQVIGNISSNLTSLNTRMDRLQAANNNTAIASGDEDMDAKLGAWVNPFIGNATQKKRNNISGYKSDSTGGTIGFDGMINDDAVLGLAYTRADTNIKLKDSKQGDKNKVHSNLYSVYGLYNLPQNNFFVEGIASYGNSDVKTKSQRNIAVAQNTVGYQTAIGKYKSENYTGQITVGYNYVLPETVSTIPAVVTPLVGIRYSDIKDKSYKETGTTYQNLIVKGKSYNTFDGMLGARLSSSFNTGEVVLTPELYAMVDYAFKNKAQAIDARLQGMAAPFPTDSFKPKKTSFDLGAGITVKHKMMEYGINYDANIASKYFAHQGSVKVRVNF